MRPNQKAILTQDAPTRWRVTVGSCSVKIYGTTNRGEPAYQLAVWSRGKRRLEMRRSWEDARARAEQLAADLDTGEAGNVHLTAEDRAIYGRARGAVGPHIDIICIEVAALRVKLGAVPLGVAVDYYVARHPTGHCGITVTDAVAEFLAARKADGCGWRHLRDLSTRLGCLAAAFSCPLRSVDTRSLSEWLRGLDLAGRNRNNTRNAVRNLFGWAAGQRYVAPDHIDWGVNGVARAKEAAEPIEIWTPAELRRLIDAARVVRLVPGANVRYTRRQGLLPLLVLGAFAGLRTSEICAQRWADIDLERGWLRVSKAKGGTPARRLVPLLPNLIAWLGACRKASDTCCDYPRPEDAMGRVARKAGIEWKANALRHSFISYRVALTKDVARTALEAGNSPRKIHSNYLELVSEDAAKEWFGVMP